MRLVNNTGLPPPILEAAKNRPYSRHDPDTGRTAHISVTQLIAPPRVFQMQERLGDDLVVDVADNLDALDGSAMHAVLEWAAKTLDPEEWIVEKRWFADVLGWTISGQSDVIRKSLALLTDYKRCSRWVAVYGAKDEWEQQLNLLRWLAHVNGVRVGKLEVFAWFKDWSKTAYYREKHKGYPEKAWDLIEIPVWPLDRAEEFAKERVRVHQQASVLPTGSLPMCTEEERWMKPEGYAVMLDGEKRARSVTKTRGEALQYMSGKLTPEQVGKAKIEQRAGPPTRCIHYCSVRHHCNFGKKVAK